MTVQTIDLKKLGRLKAPAGFSERVLSQAGIGDTYAVFDTVLGSVHVAWNGHGVSAAMRAESDEEFEEWFEREVGRPLTPGTPPADLAARLANELGGRRGLRFDLASRDRQHSNTLPAPRFISLLELGDPCAVERATIG